KRSASVALVRERSDDRCRDLRDTVGICARRGSRPGRALAWNKRQDLCAAPRARRGEAFAELRVSSRGGRRALFASYPLHSPNLDGSWWIESRPRGTARFEIAAAIGRGAHDPPFFCAPVRHGRNFVVE